MALAALFVLSVVPLRGNALTYLAGGPTIAVLTAVLLTWGRRTVISPRPLAAAALSWRYVGLPVQRLRQRVPVTA